jgi:hypothetical protein
VDIFETLVKVFKKEQLDPKEAVAYAEQRNIVHNDYVNAVALARAMKLQHEMISTMEPDTSDCLYESDYTATATPSGSIWTDPSKILKVMDTKGYFLNEKDKSFFTKVPRGYGKVYIITSPREANDKSYINYVESINHAGFVSVDENLIKCTPYGSIDGLYWNKFHPSFAYHLMRFAKNLLKQGIIKDYMLLNSGFRTEQYALALASRNADAVEMSPHRAGIAADINCIDDKQRDRILYEADAYGFGGLGRGNYYCHIDIGGLRAWGYEGIDPIARL